MSVLILALLALAAASGAAVVFQRDMLALTIVLGLHGSILAVLLLTLRAADVALAQVAVGAVAVPLMFLAAIVSARRRERGEHVPPAERAP
jgi:energy-converting hydrogenase B subunit D